MKKLKTILQSKFLFKILCLGCVIYSLIVTFIIPINSKYNIDDTIVTGTIRDYKIDGNKLKLTINGKEKIIVYYYFKTKEEKKYYEKRIELGLNLRIDGIITKPKKNTIPNGFNYQSYLKYHYINYCMTGSKITIIKKNTSVFYYLKNKLINILDKRDDTGYFRTFILGDKSFMDEEVKSSYQANGISHLFSISGMHVSLLVGMIMFILNKLSYSNYYKYSIIIPILLFYLFLTDIGASILRTVIMFIIFALDKTFNLKIKKLDLMLLVLTVAIILNPFIIQDMGFQFSYLISFTLVVFNKKTRKFKNKIAQSLYISLICFLVSFPICIYNFSCVNILSIFLNILMIPLVSIIIFPLTLLAFLIPPIYPIYKTIIMFFENFSMFISNIKILELVLIKPNIYLILIYYVSIYLTIWNLKYITIFIILIAFHKSYIYLDTSLTCTILDVGQGDSIFIKLPNNKGNILIDTGGKVKIKKEAWALSSKNYSIVQNSTIPYLKSLGINKLDYLIITHGDFDHMGEAENLIKSFKVNNVIFNKGEYNTLETNLIKLLKMKKINYYKSNKRLIVKGYVFNFLNQTIYNNSENDNSNVIYFRYSQYKFLLMGDATENNELDILRKYKINNIAFLKIGHHGSDTSSSKYFIDTINPKVSLISVGEKNRYGHPKDKVLDILSNSKILRTDLDGSIEIKLNKNKYLINNYAP